MHFINYTKIDIILIIISIIIVLNVVISMSLSLLLKALLLLYCSIDLMILSLQKVISIGHS